MRASWMALAFIAIWPVTVCAQSAIGVGDGAPDTKTHFVWIARDKDENVDKMLYLVVEDKNQLTGTNVNEKD